MKEFTRLNEYQNAVRDFHHPDDSRRLPGYALGIAGEAGEAADLIKKHWFHDHPLDRDKLVKELGDTLWYIAAIAAVIGVDMETIASVNIDKLRKRYPSGYSREASIARADVNPPTEMLPTVFRSLSMFTDALGRTLPGVRR